MRFHGFLFTSLLSLAACGDDSAAGSGGGGSGASTGASGETCSVPEGSVQLALTFPDGTVRDSTTATTNAASFDADVVGPVVLGADQTVSVTDASTGDVASFLFAGAAQPQVLDGQVVRLSLRFRARELGGPDNYQVEVTSDDTDQLLFVALRGGDHEPFEGMRLSAEVASVACSSGRDPDGAGFDVYGMRVSIDSGAAVEVPSEGLEPVATSGENVGVANLSTVAFTTPPEGYLSANIVGHVSFPDD